MAHLRLKAAWRLCALTMMLVLAASSATGATISGNSKAAEWNSASRAERLVSIERALSVIRAKGCKVKYGAESYVRAIDNLYRDPATHSLRVPEALALAATGTGEYWDC